MHSQSQEKAQEVRITNLYKIGRPNLGPIQHRVDGILINTVRVGEPILINYTDVNGLIREIRTSPVVKILESTFLPDKVEVMAKTEFSVYLVQFKV